MRKKRVSRVQVITHIVTSNHHKIIVLACLSGCGPNSPISWICEKQKKSGKRDFQQTQGSLSNDSAFGQNSSHSFNAYHHKEEREYSSTNQPNAFLSTFGAANLSQTNVQAAGNSRPASGNGTVSKGKPTQQRELYQTSSSKAHQFLREDSDEEFFNTQPEVLLDTISDSVSQRGMATAKGFTQPRLPAKQMPSNPRIGRFSPQPQPTQNSSKPKLATDELFNKQMEENLNNANPNVHDQETRQFGIGHLGEFSGNNGTSSRIVAPNVSKLSPNSAVEVRLQSSKDTVVVLCSVDVLKMRSGYFHNILTEQESKMTKQGPIPAATTSSTANILWREPIIIPEESPFEAAAFLESLHEGRAIFRGEWNYCWARLRSVLYT